VKKDKMEDAFWSLFPPECRKHYERLMQKKNIKRKFKHYRLPERPTGRHYDVIYFDDLVTPDKGEDK